MDQGKTILDAREKPKNQSGSLSEAFFGWLMDEKSQQKNSKGQEKSKVRFAVPRNWARMQTGLNLWYIFVSSPSTCCAYIYNIYYI